MKIILLPLTILMLTLFNFPSTVSAASNLEISNTSNFSTLSTNFNGGQTIFIRLESDLPSMSESKLNLRDNEYNLVNTFGFKKEGAYFSATIPVPYNAGFYSLEAVVKNDDSNTTSVKTIKVGNPTNANVKVNVNSSVSGSSSEVLGESKQDAADTSSSSNAESGAEEIEIYRAESQEIKADEQSKSLGKYISSIFREVVDFLWPF